MWDYGKYNTFEVGEMKGHKIITISTDELLNGTGVTIELDVKTNKFIVCRDLTEIKIIPIVIMEDTE